MQAIENKNSVSPSKRGGFFGKYKALTISISSFLIVFITILTISYYQSSKSAASAESIRLMARQAELIVEISRDLIDINLILERDLNNTDLQNIKDSTLKQYDRIVSSTELFDSTLKAFAEGGYATERDGSKILLNAYTIEQGKENFQTLQSTWQSFLGLINRFVLDYNTDALTINSVHYAANYARIYNTSLLTDIGLLINSLQNKADDNALITRWIQILGMIIAFSLFLFILFRVIETLVTSDALLEKTQKETSDIMQTVREGLFLVEPDYVIASSYSKELPNIIGTKRIAGRKFTDLLENLVSTTEAETTTDFIEQLFNEKVIEDLISDLNPLDRLKIFVPQEEGLHKTSYLSFNFFRVYDNKKISRVLVSVSDITENVLLEEMLEKERRVHDEELELLSSILHIQPHTLTEFIVHTEHSTRKINEILQSKSGSSDRLRTKVNDIFREVHSLKGEASALKLENYVNLMKLFEDKLRELKASSNLKGNDFLVLAIELEKMIVLNDRIKALNSSLRGHGVLEISSNSQNKSEISLDDFYSNFANDIASRHGKEVQVQCVGLEHPDLTDQEQALIKELIIQLLRNAIVHGIEKPEQRVSIGKDSIGNIEIVLQTNEKGQFLLSVKDDGRGIDFNTLRQKAVEVGVVSSQAEAENLPKKSLLRVMMSPGISTANGVDEDAGQGVGTDVILDRVRQLHGKIAVRTESNRYTSFNFVFPVQ